MVPVKLRSKPSTVELGQIPYRNPAHADLPHIVSFSGGRSSAALAFMAAQEGLLRPTRGDAVLFGNTSAEHPGTYEFAARCKERLESEFGLPCFWYEFCTVEDAWRGEYRRKMSYRLVKAVPVEQDRDGYRSSGELFEELVCLQGMLPNPHSRTCTAKLKLFPSHALLSEWLGRTTGPAHAGHHWEDTEGEGQHLVDPEAATERYISNGGTDSKEHTLRRQQFLADLPVSRPAQRWSDFTKAPVRVALPSAKPAPMRGQSGVKHVRLLGLRADEPNRVKKVLDRTFFAEGATSSKCTVSTQPPGERPYFPLFDAGLMSEDVIGWWKGRDFDLDIPPDTGNCVFCFMKGTRKLAALGTAQDERRTVGKPTDIGWWADFEQRHMRTAPKRNGEGVSRFGFLSVNAVTFKEMAAGNGDFNGRYAKGTPACDCTD